MALYRMDANSPILFIVLNPHEYLISGIKLKYFSLLSRPNPKSKAMVDVLVLSISTLVTP